MPDTLSLQLRPPEPGSDRTRLYDLLGKVFSEHGHGYFSFYDYCKRYIGRSHYDWRASSIGIKDGHIVTHCGVWGFPMRIGCNALRTAGIGAVATHRDYRGAGLMQSTMRDAIFRMQRNGYDLAVLFGIPNFYRQFGYVPAWAESEYKVPIADMPAQKPALLARLTHSRRCRRWPELDECYNAASKDLTGTAVRPCYRRFSYENILSWRDHANRLRGYIIYSPGRDELEITEVAGATEEVFYGLKRLGKRHGISQARFRGLHPRGNVAEALRLRNCDTTTRYRANGGAMLRVVNLTNALNKMTEELSRRLQQSDSADWTGKLWMSNGAENVPLQIENGTVRVSTSADGPERDKGHCIEGNEFVAQLILGSADAETVMDNYGFRVGGDGRRLAKVLFPSQDPVLGWRDRF